MIVRVQTRVVVDTIMSVWTGLYLRNAHFVLVQILNIRFFVFGKKKSRLGLSDEEFVTQRTHIHT